MFLVDGSNWMFTLTFYIVLHLRDDVLITFLLRNRLRRWRWRMTMKDQHGNIKMRIQISSLSSDQMAKRTEHIYLYIYIERFWGPESRVWEQVRFFQDQMIGEILHRQEHSNISSIPIYSRASGPGAHNDLVGAHLCIFGYAKSAGLLQGLLQCADLMCCLMCCLKLEALREVVPEAAPIAVLHLIAM